MFPNVKIMFFGGFGLFVGVLLQKHNKIGVSANFGHCFYYFLIFGCKKLGQ